MTARRMNSRRRDVCCVTVTVTVFTAAERGVCGGMRGAVVAEGAPHRLRRVEGVNDGRGVWR